MIRRALTLALLLVLIPATADAAVTSKKAIWGPTEFEAESLFPTYKSLGAGIYEIKLEWDKVAAARAAGGQGPARRELRVARPDRHGDLRGACERHPGRPDRDRHA